MNVYNATVSGYFTGFTLTTPTNDPLGLFPFQLPLSVPFPNQLIDLQPNVCKNTVCPQIAGKNYTYTNTFVLPTPVLDTAVIIIYNAKII